MEEQVLLMERSGHVSLNIIIILNVCMYWHLIIWN